MMTKLLALTILAAGALGLSTSAFASGTLTYSMTFGPNPTWSSDSIGGHQWFSLPCAAAAGGGTPNVTRNNAGTIIIGLTYTCPSTENPPASIVMTYEASMVGHMQYTLLGRTPPSGSASGSYSGTATPASGTSKSISDTYGPVAQTTTTQGLGYAPNSENLSNQTVPTPLAGWSAQNNGNGTYTYTRSITIISASGNATANCTANWKGSNSITDWEFKFDKTSFQMTY